MFHLAISPEEGAAVCWSIELYRVWSPLGFPGVERVGHLWKPFTLFSGKGLGVGVERIRFHFSVSVSFCSLSVVLTYFLSFYLLNKLAKLLPAHTCQITVYSSTHGTPRSTGHCTLLKEVHEMYTRQTYFPAGPGVGPGELLGAKKKNVLLTCDWSTTAPPCCQIMLTGKFSFTRHRDAGTLTGIRRGKGLSPLGCW